MKNKAALQLLFFLGMMLLIAAEFSCTKAKEEALLPQANPVAVSFKTNLQPLFKSTCAISGCHTGSAPTGNLNLDSAVAYHNLFAKHEIDTLHPGQSSLYITLDASSPPMPPTGRLGQDTIDMVLRWIKEGAREN